MISNNKILRKTVCFYLLSDWIGKRYIFLIFLESKNDFEILNCTLSEKSDFL